LPVSKSTSGNGAKKSGKLKTAIGATRRIFRLIQTTATLGTEARELLYFAFPYRTSDQEDNQQQNQKDDKHFGSTQAKHSSDHKRRRHDPVYLTSDCTATHGKIVIEVPVCMIELPTIEKAVGVVQSALKIGKYFQGKKEEEHAKNEDEQMRLIADELRRSTYANGPNAFRPAIGSNEDRFLSKMVVKGYLVRVPLGYMLPEFSHLNSPSLY
jgi:hypothetical protein